jgi:beta-lactamase class A
MLQRDPSQAISDAFADAGVTAGFHAVDLTTGQELGLAADDLVVPASVFKLPVLVELCRQAAEGEIDATTPVEVPVADRAAGPFGLSQMQDTMTMSLRDLAWLMMGISDNAATDVVCARVGLDKVNATMAGLGLAKTAVNGDCRDIFATFTADLAAPSMDELPELTWDAVNALSAVDPSRSLQQTTPREITRLLQLVWDDQAASPEACAEVRRILGLQVWPHRLASGFPEDAFRTSGKTGTLPTLRNEVGVVEHADGGRYAVAVFTRADSLAGKNPAADAVIGRAARIAVDFFRGE